MSRPAARSTLRLLAAAAVAASLVGAAACSSEPDGSSTKEPEESTTTVVAVDPSTTLAPIDPESVEGGEGAYIEALVPLISQSAGLDAAGTEAVSDCLAPRWVEIIGVEGFADAGLAPDDLQELGGGLEVLKVDQAQAEALVAVFAECEIDLRATTLAQLGQDSTLSDEAKACVDEALTNELLEQSLVDALTGEVDRNGAFSAIEGCARQSTAPPDEGAPSGG